MDLLKVTYAIFIFLISLCIGSFLNVVIYRLPNKMSLSTPPSHCPNCDHKIAWYDNIPLLSYILLGGKCRYCKEKISPRYFIVELSTSLLSLVIFIKYDLSVETGIGILISYLLIAISFIEIENKYLPKSLLILLLIISFLYFVIRTSEILNHLISLGVWMIVSIMIYLLSRFLTSKDFLKRLVVLGTILSVTLNYQQLIVWFILFFLVLLFVNILIKIKKGNKLECLCPYLSLTFMIAFLYGNNLIEMIIRIIR